MLAAIVNNQGATLITLPGVGPSFHVEATTRIFSYVIYKKKKRKPILIEFDDNLILTKGNYIDKGSDY